MLANIFRLSFLSLLALSGFLDRHRDDVVGALGTVLHEEVPMFREVLHLILVSLLVLFSFGVPGLLLLFGHSLPNFSTLFHGVRML